MKKLILFFAMALSAQNVRWDQLRQPVYNINLAEHPGLQSGAYEMYTPLTYIPNNTAGPCQDIYGNAVQWPIAVTGDDFGYGSNERLNTNVQVGPVNIVISFGQGGTGWTVGQTFTVNGSSGTAATGVVNAASGGAATGITITNPLVNNGYTISPTSVNVHTTHTGSGSGANLQVDLLSLQGVAAYTASPLNPVYGSCVGSTPVIPTNNLYTWNYWVPVTTTRGFASFDQSFAAFWAISPDGLVGGGMAANNFYAGWLVPGPVGANHGTYVTSVVDQVGTHYNNNLAAGGSGWSGGQTFTVNGGSVLASGHVTGVSGGAVTTYVIDTPGAGYSIPASAVGTTRTSGATGSGFTINLTGLTASVSLGGSMTPGLSCEPPVPSAATGYPYNDITTYSNPMPYYLTVQAGTFYWNPCLGGMQVYNGSAWVSMSSGAGGGLSSEVPFVSATGGSFSYSNAFEFNSSLDGLTVGNGTTPGIINGAVGSGCVAGTFVYQLSSGAWTVDCVGNEAAALSYAVGVPITGVSNGTYPLQAASKSSQTYTAYLSGNASDTRVMLVNQTANSTSNTESLEFDLESTTQQRQAASWQAKFTTVTDATRTSQMVLQLESAGSVVNGVVIQPADLSVPVELQAGTGTNQGVVNANVGSGCAAGNQSFLNSDASYVVDCKGNIATGAAEAIGAPITGVSNFTYPLQAASTSSQTYTAYLSGNKSDSRLMLANQTANSTSNTEMIEFDLNSTTAQQMAAEWEAGFSTVTNATRTSFMDLFLVNSGSTYTAVTISPTIMALGSSMALTVDGGTYSLNSSGAAAFHSLTVDLASAASIQATAAGAGMQADYFTVGEHAVGTGAAELEFVEPSSNTNPSTPGTAAVAMNTAGTQLMLAIQGVNSSNYSQICTMASGCGAGGGTIGGSIASTQVAYGSGTNTIAGASTFTWAANTLTVSGASAAYVAGDSSHTGAFNAFPGSGCSAGTYTFLNQDSSWTADCQGNLAMQTASVAYGITGGAFASGSYTISAGSTGVIQILGNRTQTITANGAQDAAFRARPIFNGSGDDITGLDVVPQFSPSSSISLARGAVIGGFFEPPSGVTITDAVSMDYATVLGQSSGSVGAITTLTTIRVVSPVLSTVPVHPTTIYGVHIQNQCSSGTTTCYGEYIDAQSGSTNNTGLYVTGAETVTGTAALNAINIGGGTTYKWTSGGDITAGTVNLGGGTTYYFNSSGIIAAHDITVGDTAFSAIQVTGENGGVAADTVTIGNSAVSGANYTLEFVKTLANPSTAASNTATMYLSTANVMELSINGAAASAICTVSTGCGTGVGANANAVVFTNGSKAYTTDPYLAWDDSAFVMTVSTSAGTSSGFAAPIFNCLNTGTKNCMQQASSTFQITGAGNGYFQIVGFGPLNTSALPTCNSGTEGYNAAVKDASTATYGATFTGSSTHHIHAYCNGTSWLVD